MEQQLRLADRRGIFSRSISAPAEFGLMILDMLDRNKETERQVDLIKLALLNDPRQLSHFFPQMFGPGDLAEGTEEAEEALETGQAVEDYSAVKWLSPKGDNEVDELVKLQEALASAASVSVTQNTAGEWI